MKDEFLKGRAAALSVTVAGGLDLTKMKFHNSVSVTETRNHVVCKRLTKWERLRIGVALSDVCHCPFCQGFPTAV